MTRVLAIDDEADILAIVEGVLQANGHDPMVTREFTTVDGDSLDHYYGELGVAGLAYELGTQFFESCSYFENNILPGNLDSLLYAAKVVRTPFLTPAGPEGIGAAVSPASVTAGATRDADARTSTLGKCPAFARSRLSTTCPSETERTVSPIGSFTSSPSTSTV